MRQSKTTPLNTSQQLVQHRPQFPQQPGNVWAVHDPRNDIVMQNAMGVGVMDDFFKDFLDFTKLEDQVFGFSNLHSRLGGMSQQGTGYSMQCFSSVSTMGPDGQMKNEQYYENSMGHKEGGNTISERQQAYQNSLGAARVAEERRLNDQGRKVIKEKRGNETIQSNHFYNLDEGRIGEFDSRWEGINRDTKFLETYQKSAPRQQIDFNTVNRMAQQQRQMMPQLQQGAEMARSNAPSLNVSTANPYQSAVRERFNPQALTNGSRVTNIGPNPINMLNGRNSYKPPY